MKKLAAAIALATLLPLAGCATPYGYSPGAWANYDGDYDYGQDGYDRPDHLLRRGALRPALWQWLLCEPALRRRYYAQQPAYAPQAYGPPPGYGGGWYSTYYSGCGCN